MERLFVFAIRRCLGVKKGRLHLGKQSLHVCNLIKVYVRKGEVSLIAVNKGALSWP